MADNDKPADKPAAKIEPKSEFTPVVMLVSEAGMGLRRDEIRGFAADVAADMISKKLARKPTDAEMKTGKVTPPSE